MPISSHTLLLSQLSPASAQVVLKQCNNPHPPTLPLTPRHSPLSPLSTHQRCQCVLLRGGSVGCGMQVHLHIVVIALPPPSSPPPGHSHTNVRITSIVTFIPSP
jgi:hypothetical protein